MDGRAQATSASGPRWRKLFVLVLLTLALGLTACSPEASRIQGGGRGSDVGNRDANVEMHGAEEGPDARDTRMYNDTPIEITTTGE
ncbi:MAG: hypothetical protein M3Q71_12700 [Chloroflexota bacterium]|nr:hypothetical protein [Chloroflexota bacterium]